METKLPQVSPTLYDTDYHLWVLETVKQLENRDFHSVDWNNLEDVCQVKKSSSNDLLSVDKNATELLEPCLNHTQQT